jgi:hypothetical protein
VAVRRPGVNEAQAKKVAAELGVELPPATPKKRVTRKRTSNRNGPVQKSFKWSAVRPEVRLHALFMADQDIRRCIPIDADTVKVVNNPGKVPR